MWFLFTFLTSYCELREVPSLRSEAFPFFGTLNASFLSDIAKLNNVIE